MISSCAMTSGQTECRHTMPNHFTNFATERKAVLMLQFQSLTRYSSFPLHFLTLKAIKNGQWEGQEQMYTTVKP